MKTFKTIFTIIIIAFISIKTTAQNKQDKIRYAIEMADKEYKDIIRYNMNFTESETNAFWPILNEYLTKKDEVFAKEVNIFLTDYSKLSARGAENILKRMNKSEKELRALKNKYFKKIKKHLPIKKYLRFLQIDHYIEVARDFKLSSQMPLVRE
ncbi:hypothetical protein WH52_11210 [Tenacibaculum holothuriorum]|uniref:Sensor of ECF-type sigma factor n=1 Tax=Tenacibaculum holothuriorum TaxID=1635173 RepID=A0A1Y2PCC3_9FLAO|nr:hypothetical protein [Tenacibaculum holothuriorum]OSY87437.1 hypothetical protein WH52_11210 [Tenacibaculum holothuriorum]